MVEMGALEPAGTQAHVLRRRQNKQRFPGATFGTAARWQTRAEWADRRNGGILQHDRAELDRLATGGYFRSCAADADDIGRPVWHQVARVPLVEAGGRPAENHAANFQHCGDNGPGPGGYAPFEDSFGTGKKVSASCKIWQFWPLGFRVHFGAARGELRAAAASSRSAIGQRTQTGRRWRHGGC